MIVLDKHSYELLHYLIKLEEPETIMEISRHLEQSRRKVYYHLEKINDSLPVDVPSIVAYPRVGILLTDVQKEACQHLLDELDDYSYVMSAEERIELTLTYIAIAKTRVTIEKLMQLNDVSRNTVLNDLNDIREKLSIEEYDIQLRVTKSRGYYLECHPLSKIQYLYRLLYCIYTERNQSFIAIVKEKIIDLTGFNRYFSEEVHLYLQETLSSAQEKLGKKINSRDRHFMIQILPYLLLSYQSVELTDKEKTVIQEEFRATLERLEYRLAEEIAAGLRQHFDLELDRIEISLVTMLLLSFRKDIDGHLESQDYVEMRKTLEVFLQTLQLEHNLYFVHHHDLLNQLLTHCKALIYRKKYGILSTNPLTTYIINKYTALFQATKEAIPILEEAWSIQMTDSDIAYIAIHLGGELERSSGKVLSKKRVTLVCDEGVGVQKLLLNQCRQCLPQAEMMIFTVEQFYSIADILETDLVVTTSDALETQFPILVVHPILDMNDMMHLVHFAKYNSAQLESSFSQELDKCLHLYVADTAERQALIAKIEQLVRQELIGTV